MKKAQKQIEDARRRDAYKRTDSDVEAAELLGLQVGTYQKWRVSRGLKAKGQRGRPLLTPN